jgi:hypothetical protein
LVNRLPSIRGAPSIAVETIRTIRTTTPKKSENHSAIRNTSDPGLRSRLLPVAIATVVSRAVTTAALAISTPAGSVVPG